VFLVLNYKCVCAPRDTQVKLAVSLSSSRIEEDKATEKAPRMITFVQSPVLKSEVLV
jgi:hypothetical protein